MQWNSEHFRVNSKEHCVIGRRNLKLGNIVTPNSVYGKIRDKWEVRKVCLFIQNLLERRGVKDVVESTRFDLKFRKRHVLIKRRQGLIWSSGNGMFWLKGGNTFYRQSDTEWWRGLLVKAFKFHLIRKTSSESRLHWKTSNPDCVHVNEDK